MRGFKWLVCSARPLKLHELATGAAIVPEDRIFDPEFLFDDDEAMLEILGPLIHFSRATHTVSIAHFSVTEYFTSRKLSSEQSNNPHYIDVTKTHGEILKSCFIYLRHTSPESNPPFPEDSFMQYAVVHWPFHARFVESLPVYRDLIISFLHAGAWHTMYDRWHTLYAHEIPTLHTVPDEMRSSLYYAAYLGFPTVVERLLKFPEYSNKPIMKGYALVGAALSSQFQIIARLLEEDINIDFFSREGIPALSIAMFCLHDQPRFVQLLSSRGSPSMSSILGGDIWTPLHLKAIYGDLEGAKSQLANGADLYDRTEVRGFTALHLAAWYKNTQMLNVFIRHIYRTKGERLDIQISSGHAPIKIVDGPPVDASNLQRWEDGAVVDGLSMYRVLLTLFPDDFILYEFAGDAYLEKKLHETALELYHISISLNPKNSGVHSIEDVNHCDFCHNCKSSTMSPKPITGYRHRCTVCPDFDLCEHCYNLTGIHEGSHSFLSIPRPGWVENQFGKLASN